MTKLEYKHPISMELAVTSQEPINLPFRLKKKGDMIMINVETVIGGFGLNEVVSE